MAEPDVIPSEQMYADTLARLTTAEQERDKALMQLHYVPDEWRYAGQLHAAQDAARVAEGRVEAAERERDQAVAAMREIQRKYVRTGSA